MVKEAYIIISHIRKLKDSNLPVLEWLRAFLKKRYLHTPILTIIYENTGEDTTNIIGGKTDEPCPIKEKPEKQT